MRRLGLAALAALPFVLLATGCDPQCVDNWDCNFAQTGNVCFQHQCVPLNCAGTNPTWECNQNTEVCDPTGGKCKTCYKDTTNNTYPGCSAGGVCDTAANNGDGACVECLASTDCSNPTPYCDAPNKTCMTCLSDNTGCTAPTVCDVSKNGGTGACVGCLTSANCSGATPNCDTATQVCKTCLADNTGCSGATPVCNTAGGSGAGACVQCMTGHTAACTGATPNCDTTAHVCKTCLADNTGCSGATPACNTAASGGAGACVECMIDGDCASGVCDTTAHVCKTCLANDHGCEGTPLTPACDTAAASGAGACVQCSATNGTACTGSTTVCDAANHVCKTCLDSAAAGQQDNGCSAGLPICDPAANSGAGQCFGCLGNTDCSTGAPVCDTAGTKTCKICLADNTGCNAPTACNTSGNGGLGQCYGCTQDSPDCDSTPATPHCNTSVTPGQCVECLNSTQCSASTAPACGASNHCGCSNSTECAAVPSTTTPVCDATKSSGNGQCVVCTATEGCSGATPACLPDQSACVQCNGDSDCATNPNGSVCDTTAHTCVSAAKVMAVKVVGCSDATCSGAAALSNAAAAVFLEEYTQKSAGAPLRMIAMPIAVSPTGNTALVMAGTSTAEGGLSRSGDGKYVLLAGYNATPTTASTGINGAASTATNRIIGRVDAAGTIDTTTHLSATGASFSAGNIRGAVSTNGTDLWAVGSNTGVVYAQLGDAAGGTTISGGSTLVNMRTISIFPGLGAAADQLYISSLSSTWQGISAVGSGTPTAAGQTITLLPGFPTVAGSGIGPYGFAALDLDATPGIDTLYLSNSNAPTTGTGVLNAEKWTLQGATWTKDTTFVTPTIAANAGTFGMVAVRENGAVHLFVTTTGGQVLTWIDGAAPTAVVLGSAGTNAAFRGAALSPVP